MLSRLKIIPTPERLRRLAARGLIVLQVLLAILIFGMLNNLAGRHYQRWHWEHQSRRQLSNQTLRILDAMPGRIRMTALIRPSNPVFHRVSILLEEYATQGDKVSVEIIHPDRDMAPPRNAFANTKLPGGECIVIETGGRHRAIPWPTRGQRTMPASGTTCGNCFAANNSFRRPASVQSKRLAAV